MAISILNRGRCSRCIASKKKPYVIKYLDENKKPTGLCKNTTWLFCDIFNNFCSCVAGFICKEPPMGISAEDYTRKIKEVNQ